jgi:hypothetical protein
VAESVGSITQNTEFLSASVSKIFERISLLTGVDTCFKIVERSVRIGIRGNDPLHHAFGTFEHPAGGHQLHPSDGRVKAGDHFRPFSLVVPRPLGFLEVGSHFGAD